MALCGQKTGYTIGYTIGVPHGTGTIFYNNPVASQNIAGACRRMTLHFFWEFSAGNQLKSLRIKDEINV